MHRTTCPSSWDQTSWLSLRDVLIMEGKGNRDDEDEGKDTQEFLVRAVLSGF